MPWQVDLASSSQAADVGEEVRDAVELAALLPHELEGLEVDVQGCQVLPHVLVLAVLRVGGCKGGG